ncbi:MAG: tetratricopeptide repeat protein [Gammaproteobacteria bacterium]
MERISISAWPRPSRLSGRRSRSAPREALPQQWAMTQNNLGNALQAQGIRTSGEAGAKLLSKAVAVFQAAQEVYTRESLPQQWAVTQHNLARAYTALEDWPKAAASYAELLHANLDDGEAYQKAGWLYHEKLSDFGAAFALNQQWLERHPEDLSVQGDFAERHFTTGRFVEAKERLAALLANPALDPQIRIGLQALEIAALLALNDTRAVPQRLERLRAAVQSRPQDFQVGWLFAGSKHFIATDPRLVPHWAWLQTLFTALESENRDAILAALDGVREKLTQREGDPVPD